MGLNNHSKYLQKLFSSRRRLALGLPIFYSTCHQIFSSGVNSSRFIKNTQPFHHSEAGRSLLYSLWKAYNSTPAFFLAHLEFLPEPLESEKSNPVNQSDTRKRRKAGSGLDESKRRYWKSEVEIFKSASDNICCFPNEKRFG